MADIDDDVYLLRGGVRDGQFTTVTTGLTRLISASDAPGLVEVYELTDERVADPEHAGHLVGVFTHVGQEAAPDFAPELEVEGGHQPHEHHRLGHRHAGDPVPGDG